MRGFELVYPRPPIAARQLLAGPLELIGAAGIIYFALPQAGNPGFIVVLGVFLASFTLALVSHAPGGLGVLEFSFLKAMPDAPPASVIAALLVFRLLYLILPLLFSLFVVVAFERERIGELARARWGDEMMADALAPRNEDALIVVDVQNDFVPGGALAVPDGDAILPLVNRLTARSRTSSLTQDWHPAGHASFASSHPGAKPFDVIADALRRAGAVAGPLRAGLAGRRAASRARRRFAPFSSCARAIHATVDSYSAFVEADRDDDRARRAARARGASAAFSSAAWRPISASPFPRSTRARRASRPS